ncbi:hypothetical protein RYX36_034976, partial [Vicia faba]
MRIIDEGNEVQLTLNQHSGSRFTSRKQYGSGVFNMKIRMLQKDSTAMITIIYV